MNESTDVSVNKYLCICIRYYSHNLKKIITSFLTILNIELVTATELYKILTEYLTSLKLDTKNLIGLGTDGANNLCGKHHSLHTILKEHVPNLQLLNCICHSLHNTASKAVDELPASLDFLCREVYNWFSSSPLHRIEYCRLFNILNDDDRKFRQFSQVAQTRCLSRHECIKKILEHYEDLKIHFAFVVNK